MKFFAVAVVASVLVAVSLAAPTTSVSSINDLLQLEEVGSGNLTVAHLACIRQSVKKVLVKNQIDQSWNTLNNVLNNHLNDYRQCAATMSDRFACGRVLAKESGAALRHFFRHVFSSDLDLLSKLRTQIIRDCYSKPAAEAFVEMIDSSIVPQNAEAAKKILCAVGVIDEVWTENNLGPEWNETKQALAPPLEKLAACTDQLCTVKETISVAVILYAFTSKVQKEHPEVYKEIEKRVQARCTDQPQERYTVSDDVVPQNAETAKKIGCAVGVIDEVWTENNLGPEWNETKQALVPHLEKLATCTDQSCTVEETVSVAVILYAFTSKVQKEHPEVYKEIEKRVQARCTDQPQERYTVSVDDNGETVDYVGILTCAIDIADSVTTDFELNTIWESYASQLSLHLENVTLCKSASDEDAVQECFERESQTAMTTYRAFLALVREASEEAAEKILSLYRSECLKVDEDVTATPTESTDVTSVVTEEAVEDRTEDVTAEPTEEPTVEPTEEPTEPTVNDDAFESNDNTVDYVSILSCAIDIGDSVTTDFELDTIWESFEPQLMAHLENFTLCKSAGDEDAVQECFERESQAASTTYKDFLAQVRQASEDAAEKILTLYRSECLSVNDGTTVPPTESTDVVTEEAVEDRTEDVTAEPTEESTVEPTEEPTEPTHTDDAFESNDNTVDYVGNLRCAINVGESVSTEYDLNTIWESFEPQLLAHLENVTNCASAKDDDAVQACYDRESEAAVTTYRGFLALVREENQEAADTILRVYRSECLNADTTESPPTATTEEPVEPTTEGQEF